MKYNPFPMSFFFYRRDDGKLWFTLNGEHFPDRKTLKEMSSVLRQVLLFSDKELKKLNLEITERQEEEEKELMEENRNSVKIRAPKKGFIYLIKSLNLYKIGRCENPNRIKTYRTENPHHIDLIFQIEVLDCVGIEKMLLEKYSSKKYKGEWFKLNTKDILEIRDILTY